MSLTPDQLLEMAQKKQEEMAIFQGRQEVLKRQQEQKDWEHKQWQEKQWHEKKQADEQRFLCEQRQNQEFLAKQQCQQQQQIEQQQIMLVQQQEQQRQMDKFNEDNRLAELKFFENQTTTV